MQPEISQANPQAFGARLAAAVAEVEWVGSKLDHLAIAPVARGSHVEYVAVGLFRMAADGTQAWMPTMAGNVDLTLAWNPAAPP